MRMSIYQISVRLDGNDHSWNSISVSRGGHGKFPKTLPDAQAQITQKSTVKLSDDYLCGLFS